MRGLSQADSGRPTPASWPQPPPPAARGRRAAPSSDCGPAISEHPITARPLSGARIKSLSCREETQTGQSQPVRHGVRHQAARSPPQEPGAACGGHQRLSAASPGCGSRPGLRAQGTARHTHKGSGLQQGRQRLTTRLLAVLQSTLKQRLPTQNREGGSLAQSVSLQVQLVKVRLCGTQCALHPVTGVVVRRGCSVGDRRGPEGQAGPRTAGRGSREPPRPPGGSVCWRHPGCRPLV